MQYEHTQVGYVTGSVSLAALPLIYYAFTAANGELGAFGYTMLGVFGGFTILFSSLTVQVTDRELIFYFGPGFWERRFPIDKIERVEAVRNSALFGWGIRYTHHGWLYNVSGLGAIEITVRGEEQLRIGTDEPERLRQTIKRASTAAP